MYTFVVIYTYVSYSGGKTSHFFWNIFWYDFFYCFTVTKITREGNKITQLPIKQSNTMKLIITKIEFKLKKK